MGMVEGMGVRRRGTGREGVVRDVLFVEIYGGRG